MSLGHVIRGHAKVMTRAYVRVKILKCSKSTMINFEYVLGHFKHFKILRAFTFARAFLRVKSLCSMKSQFLLYQFIVHYILSNLIPH